MKQKPSPAVLMLLHYVVNQLQAFLKSVCHVT